MVLKPQIASHNVLYDTKGEGDETIDGVSVMPKELIILTASDVVRARPALISRGH